MFITEKDSSDLHMQLSAMIGNALRADIARLQRDELFADVIPAFDSLVVIEIILLIEEREGIQFDRYLEARDILIAANAESCSPVFPPNISALVRAVLHAKQAEAQLSESEACTRATNLMVGVPDRENSVQASIRDRST